MVEMHIPKVSRDEIISRYSRIRPVAKKGGKLYWIRPFADDELNKGYLWEDGTIGDLVKEGEIVPIVGSDFRCLHWFSYPAFFQPTIAEVLSQISRKFLYTANAFEIIEQPLQAEDFYKDQFTTDAFNSGYHVSTVRLYKHP